MACSKVAKMNVCNKSSTEAASRSNVSRLQKRHLKYVTTEISAKMVRRIQFNDDDCSLNNLIPQTDDEFIIEFPITFCSYLKEDLENNSLRFKGLKLKNELERGIFKNLVIGYTPCKGNPGGLENVHYVSTDHRLNILGFTYDNLPSPKKLLKCELCKFYLHYDFISNKDVKDFFDTTFDFVDESCFNLLLSILMGDYVAAINFVNVMFQNSVEINFEIAKH